MYLAGHVRLCRTGGDTIGLDLKRNRYFLLGSRETQVIAMVAPNLPESLRAVGDAAVDLAAVDSIVNALIGAGLLSSDPEEASRREPYVDLGKRLVSVGYEQDDSATPGLHHLASALCAWAWARHALHRRTLYSVLQEIQRNRPGVHDSRCAHSRERALQLTAVFRHIRPYVFSAKNQCLLHALTLTRFLSSYAVYPTWVIGVRTHPWAAHSWAQLGEFLLDGRPDDVRDYTPILIA